MQQRVFSVSGNRLDCREDIRDMPKLFGLDIAKMVNDSIKSAGNVRPGILEHANSPYTRDQDDKTSGLQPTITIHAIRGFVETKEIRRLGQVGTLFSSAVYIIGASVNPKVVPRVNDTVTMDGGIFFLVELLELDPALALYKFLAEI